MSLKPCDAYTVPSETSRIARTIFPDGNLVMRMYDDLRMLVHDADFVDLFPIQGQPAKAPARLALATLLQFWEGLTDRRYVSSQLRQQSREFRELSLRKVINHLVGG